MSKQGFDSELDLETEERMSVDGFVNLAFLHDARCKGQREALPGLYAYLLGVAEELQEEKEAKGRAG